MTTDAAFFDAIDDMFHRWAHVVVITEPQMDQVLVCVDKLNQWFIGIPDNKYPISCYELYRAQLYLNTFVLPNPLPANHAVSMFNQRVNDYHIQLERIANMHMWDISAARSPVLALQSANPVLTPREADLLVRIYDTIMNVDPGDAIFADIVVYYQTNPANFNATLLLCAVECAFEKINVTHLDWNRDLDLDGLLDMAYQRPLNLVYPLMNFVRMAIERRINGTLVTGRGVAAGWIASFFALPPNMGVLPAIPPLPLPPLPPLPAAAPLPPPPAAVVVPAPVVAAAPPLYQYVYYAPHDSDYANAVMHTLNGGVEPSWYQPPEPVYPQPRIHYTEIPEVDPRIPIPHQ